MKFPDSSNDIRETDATQILSIAIIENELIGFVAILTDSNHGLVAMTGNQQAGPDSPLEWRKCMGIEPTDRMVYIQPNGFEDRAEHQPWFHFRTIDLMQSIVAIFKRNSKIP